MATMPRPRQARLRSAAASRSLDRLPPVKALPSRDFLPMYWLNKRVPSALPQ